MNSVNLIGRLTKQNELKSYQNQNGEGYVLKNSLAVNITKDEAMFIDFTAWGKSAQYIATYSNKGDKIAISGELRLEQWQDAQTGQNRSKHIVNVSKCEILATANNGANNGYPNGYNQQNVYQGATDNLGYPVQNAQNSVAQNNAPAQHGNYGAMPPEVQQAVARNNQNAHRGGFDIPPDEIPF